jgi:hypothetical protein
MRFAPQKYTLTHFTGKRNVGLEAPIRINNEEIAPSPVVRILGLQLDSKLRWKAHIKAVNLKMKTQMYALSRIAASTWGCYNGKITADIPSCSASSNIQDGSGQSLSAVINDCPVQLRYNCFIDVCIIQFNLRQMTELPSDFWEMTGSTLGFHK